MQPPHSRAAASARAKTSIVALASVSAIALLVLSLLSPIPGARAVTIYASDTFNRTASNGWGTADTGGGWTVAGTAANWSVAPGAGSVNVPANGQERGYLGSVAVQDVEVTAKIVLPRSTQNNNAIAYLLGRDSGAGGGYYRVGVGQGTGSGIILRTQRSDGTSLGGDLATGITASDGAIVWLRVQFEGVNPTAIRARAWLDGAVEPATWLLNVTDSTAAQQISGAVGVRMRNEDTAAAHVFRVQSFTAASFVGAPPPTPTPTSPPPTATPTSPPPGPLATDTFARSATGGWSTADTGGFWTTFGSPWNWSVSPGAGAIAAAANADERGYLSAVNTRDVDVTAQVVLPRSGQANNALAYVIGRFVAAYNPTYYAVGVGQGTGANIILRAQRSDGTSIGADLNTGITAADGAVVWLHVQFQGASPTAIRARAWLDGNAEPSTWLLNTTDSTAAEQVAGAVGLRARNEDTAAARTFQYRNFQASGTAVAKAPPTPNPTGGTLHHYLYTFPDQSIDVFDIDNGHALIKHITVPTSGVAGAAMSPATGMVYIEECVGNCETSSGGRILKYNLVTDTVVWAAYYPFGVDNGAITLDGARLYSPDGENATDGLLHVLDAASGVSVASITTNMGGHNTVAGLNGTRVYSGGFNNGTETRYLHAIDPTTNTVVKLIGPLKAGVRPFTVNGVETLAFTTATNFLGFEVSSITSGQLLYSVPVVGFTNGSFVTNAPSHGVTLSPDEREVYVVDGPNAYVHVFNVTGLPGSAPVQVADIPLSSLAGSHSPCASRCQREGWMLHSRDGRYVWVGDSGDVIDTTTRTIVATLQSLRNTRNYLEIDWQNAAPVFTTTKSGLGYVGAPTPTPTATPTAIGSSTATFTASSTTTATRTPTATVSATSTASSTSTITSTSTASSTATASPSATASSTSTTTATPTRTPTATASSTPTATQTSTSTATATNTATNTTTATATLTSTVTHVPTSTASVTGTATATHSATASVTSTPVPTSTDTPVPTSTATDTGTPSATSTPVATSTDTPVPTSTATHTATPSVTSTPVATSTNTPGPTSTDTPAPTSTVPATATPTNTATSTPTDTATAVPTDTATPTATETQTPVTPSETPTATETPTPTESAVATATSTETATPTPTIDPTLDTDGDGCPDARELGPTWQQGGQRDPNSPWDFFDVPLPPLLPGHTSGARDRVVTIGDVIGVLNYVGTSTSSPAAPNAEGAMYGSDLDGNGVADGQQYDRSAGSDGSQLWRSGPPRGFVSIGTALVALSQVGTNCS